MKKRIINLLKILLPLALGAFLIYYYYGNIDEQQKVDIIDAFKRADYSWVLLSIIPAVLSHVSRAYRWKYTIKPLGHKMDFVNAFFSVMIGYLVNLAIPRLGEVSRCATMSRVEKVPFEKLVGTVIAERVADLVILLIFIFTVTIVQYQKIEELLLDIGGKLLEKVPGYAILIALAVIGLSGLFVLYKVYTSTSENKVLFTLRKILHGVVDGVLSILKMKDKWAFLFHTLFIWAMYVAMFWVCIYALPETHDLSVGAIISGFVLGGIAMATTNGGIGAYPIAIQSVFAIYMIEESVGGAIGWIMWTAQTILILLLGGISFALIPIYNRKKNEQLESNPAKDLFSQ